MNDNTIVIQYYLWDISITNYNLPLMIDMFDIDIELIVKLNYL